MFQRIEKDNPTATRETVKTIYDGCEALKDFPPVAVPDV
jgi:plasmid stabilization system protein ParE